MRLNLEALKYVHVGKCVEASWLWVRVLRVSPGAERSGDSKRADYGVLIEHARDKNLLLSHSPARRIVFAYTFSWSLQKEFSAQEWLAQKAIRVCLISPHPHPQGCLLQSMVSCLHNSRSARPVPPRGFDLHSLIYLKDCRGPRPGESPVVGGTPPSQ